MMENIRRNDPINWKLCGLTNKDILCVSLAGLLHDIGHGPYSHFWDNTLIPLQMAGNVLHHPHEKISIKKWTHELASKLIIDRIYKNNAHVRGMCDFFDITPGDIEFIKELIDPKGLKHLQDDQAWRMKGRGQEKAFLYEIISNKRSGLDVDKLDYLKRDLKYCKGTDVNIDYIRLFQNCKIEFCPGNGNRSLISIRDKCDTDVMEVYKLREKNHREM